MRRTITSSSTYVEQQLKLYPSCNPSWTVHSVYQKTVNIQTGRTLLALQAASSPLSPVSMITDMEAGCFGELPIRPGQPVSVAGGRITVYSPESPTVFLYQPEEIYDSHLDSPSSGFSQKELLSRIRKAISDSRAGIFRLLICDSPDAHGAESMDPGGQAAKKQMEESQDPGGMILAAARRHMLRCSGHLEQKMYDCAAKSLAGLIGLGIGLTPSGDDFLCGVMAALILCGLHNHPFTQCLSREISAHLSDTNDISRAFLNCSLERHFSRAVKSLAGMPDADDIGIMFSAIGHSSGIDTLCGAAYGMSRACGIPLSDCHS